jgi:hypothetical protein
MLECEVEGRKHRAVSCNRFTSDEALGCPSPQHPNASTIFSQVGPASQKAPEPLHPFVKGRSFSLKTGVKVLLGWKCSKGIDTVTETW